MNPLVSIIIPCYNAEDYVAETITSCLRQTYQRIEIIVVNDGSTDSSHDIIMKFQDYIVFIDQTNKGGSAARNTGLKRAQGTYIKFLDADDFLETSIIEKQVDRFRKSGPACKIAVYGDVKTVEENGNITGILKQPLIQDSDAGLATLIDYAIITSSPLYRKEDLEKVNGFNETLKSGQEHELNLKLFLSGVRFRYYSDLVFFHRNYVSPHRISSRKWPVSDPYFMWRLIDHYERMIQNQRGKINGEINAALASKLISAGRSLVRVGNIDLGDQHFERAIRICPDKKFRIGNRVWITKYYLTARNVLGLNATEKIYFTFVNGLNILRLKK